MRMMATRYTDPKPARAKPGSGASLAHVSAPLKGLNLSSKLTTGDPLTAPILTNFVIEDDRIKCRAGTRKVLTHADAKEIETLIPWYGATPRLAAATNNKIIDALTGTLLQGGFTGNDWSWTSFANLGQQKFTVMCNGVNGVWSWNGQLAPSVDPGPVAVTNLSNANPAVCTVAATDIAKFISGQTVVIAGADATHAAANGAHVIQITGLTTFSLTGVDLSAAAGPQVSGVTADPPALQPLNKELVTAPPANPWIVPDQFNIVLVHMNRLFFADTTNLAVYYLPLQSKSGEVKVLPLNALFKRGGSIRALYTWTLEGGVGINDQLCIFSSNGELVIYAGTDPDTDFNLVGIFRFDAPMSKRCIINYGGDLYVQISTGLVPLSTMLRAESEQLGKEDRSVISLFLSESIKYRDRKGWEVFINPSTGRVMCNIPQGSSNRYTQLVRHMPRPVWSQYQDLPARTFAWIDPYVYFGTDDGRVYQMHPDFLNDDGGPIRVDVQMSWSLFKLAGIKHFKMVKAYMVTDATVRPFIDVKTDYDLTPPEMQPDVSMAATGAVWDLADWDTSDWAQGALPISMWNGVGRIGRVGAPRLTAYILNAEFSITGWDVIFEGGAAL